MADPSSPPPAPQRVMTAPLPVIAFDDAAAETTGSDADSEPTAREPSPAKKAWKRRGPGVEWYIRDTQHAFQAGRVLIIDYIARQSTQEGRRKIIAQELQDIIGLRKFYNSRSSSVDQTALRVIHVQSAPWATRFFLRKFAIDFNIDAKLNASDDSVGTTFGRWAKYDKPQRRKGKPVLNGKTFRAQRDPWRGISRTAFGVDCLRTEPHITGGASNQEKIAELNGYNVQDEPTAMVDIVASRLSVYIQYKDDEPDMPADSDTRNPYEAAHQDDYVPNIATLDNGSTIIIFDNGSQGSSDPLAGSLIAARGELEQRWRRLTFYLPADRASTDGLLAKECMAFVLQDIFKCLAFHWEKLLGRCSDHINILEEQVYEWPADESRAVELWRNASTWLTLEKLIFVHTDVSKEMRYHLGELFDDREAIDKYWSSDDEFYKLANIVQEDTVKPTEALNQLMYRSVTYRDSRISLKLNASLWRLSWITFIFLPLTFLVSFFGMNVDTFEHNPSIKWYFVAAVCLMALVVMLWYCVKHSLNREHQTRQRRGVYEAFNHELAENYPQSWTRTGPRTDNIPSTWMNNWKWRLLKSWYAPQNVVPTSGGLEIEDSDLGIWSRLKQRLTRRWLAKMSVDGYRETDMLLDDVELGTRPKTRHAKGIEVLLAAGTQTVTAVAIPSVKLPTPIPTDEEN